MFKVVPLESHGGKNTEVRRRSTLRLSTLSGSGSRTRLPCERLRIGSEWAERLTILHLPEPNQSIQREKAGVSDV